MERRLRCSSGGASRHPWRRPLREALDWLRDAFRPVLSSKWMRALLRRPVVRAHDSIDVLLDPSRESVTRFFERHAIRASRSGSAARPSTLLELQRNALLMFTSCGWFFDDPAASRPDRSCGTPPDRVSRRKRSEDPSSRCSPTPGARAFRFWRPAGRRVDLPPSSARRTSPPTRDPPLTSAILERVDGRSRDGPRGPRLPPNLDLSLTLSRDLRGRGGSRSGRSSRLSIPGCGRRPA